MIRRTICRAQVIWLISILLAFPEILSAQAAGDGIGVEIVGTGLQKLHTVADFSLELTVAHGTNIPGREKENPLGPKFGITIYGHGNIGFDMEFAYQIGWPGRMHEKIEMFEYFFGPRFSTSNNRRATVFGHILLGGLNRRQDISGFGVQKAKGFAMAYGGGLNVNVNKQIALRIVQLDWIPIHDGSWKTGVLRFGSGIVLRSAK
jgi:hypothetical protein